MPGNDSKLAIIPLGGLGEIGKNMLAIRYSGHMLVIDCGLIFPEDDMFGIDVVIPDMTYLLENKNQLRGIVLTHGHEDHIGALPYLLRELDVPLYGTKLTLGLVQAKLREQEARTARLNCLKPREVVKLGPFRVELIRVSHSIADAAAVAVHTPVGTIVHTGDFKFDPTPVDGEGTDFYKFAELGEKGVLVLLSDSTNVERPGYTLSERTVGEAFAEAFRQAKERIIVASFASNIPRIQQVINLAAKFNRRVAVVGRSMVNVVSIASELGYLHVPPGTLVEVDEANRLPHREVVILTTGSQGEPMSALSRMAAADHRQLEIVPGDTVLISSNPIPGNEKMVARIIDQLFRQGADVIHEALSGIHVSGHASQEELKLMLNLVRPRFFVPVHGEYRMLVKHARLAEQVGIPPDRIFVCENGQVLEFTRDRGSMTGTVPAGRVLVDGLGVGDVGNIVLRDRKQLAQDGILIVVLTLDREARTVVAGPDIVSRGFVYVREAEALLEEAKEKVNAVLSECLEKQSSNWGAIKGSVRESLGRFLYERTGRRPMILPIIMEV
ncbi:MAG: ribonuclease J [Moorellales bacterium]